MGNFYDVYQDELGNIMQSKLLFVVSHVIEMRENIYWMFSLIHLFTNCDIYERRNIGERTIIGH